MSDNYQRKNHRLLGNELKKLRVNLRESAAEVSGSVEIDIDELVRFENGEARPSEEILLLLISHFGLTDSKADKLWGLAGYSNEDKRSDSIMLDIEQMQQAGAFVLPNDAKILYTDVMHAIATANGITVNFMQSAGPMGKPMIVSRVGMSKEHAKSMIELLQRIIDAPEPQIRLLEGPNDSN
ncbi:hypothetical protein BH23PAT2_BH23PAT2_06410 [soil metagenome]